MIRQYETVFIFSPVLKESESKKATQEYVELLKDGGAEIVAEDLWGLRQLAYPIDRRTTGIYYVVEYKMEGAHIDKMELKAKRDPNVLRFLTVKLDKYAIDYNDKKRKGLISKYKEERLAKEAAATSDSETQNTEE